jgi:hypothetical protein
VNTNAHDLWTDYLDRMRRSDWTCRGHYSDDGPIPEGNIDRIVTLRPTLIDSEISVTTQHNDWIPLTDHRAVVGRVVHATQNASHGCNPNLADRFIRQPNNKPHIKIPSKSEKDKYQIFSDSVDKAVRTNSLHKLTVADDETFLKLYKGLSSIITTTAVKVFGK